MKGAARANFLFGHVSSDMHRQQLDMPSEERAALEWLKANPVFCELVVQSLRVMNTVGFGRQGTVGAVVGERILEEFGRQFPAAPEPDSYEALVMRAIKTLTLEDQRSIAQWQLVGNSRGSHPLV